jgi:hypothetical protein
MEEYRMKVFENRVLRRIFGPKRDEMTGDWRKLHNEELHNLYSSPNIIRMILSKRMLWAGNVAYMRKTGNVHRTSVGEPDEKSTRKEDLDECRMIILKSILEK